MKDYDSTSPASTLQEDTDTNALEDHSRNENDFNEEDTTEEINDEDAVKWDGSEAELVVDTEAEEYEEHYTGLKISYLLNREEILTGIKRSGICQTNNKKLIWETVLLSVASILSFATYAHRGNTVNLILGVIGVLLIGAIWGISKYNIKNIAHTMFSKKTMYVEFYPDSIVVGRDDFETEISLDGTSGYEEYDDMFIIYPPKMDVLIIPIRAVEPDFIPEIQAMLLAGTVPKKTSKK